jgi:hypothetical protein
MIDLTRLVTIALLATSACKAQRLDECQNLTSRIAQGAQLIMAAPLDSPGFERVLGRARSDMAALDVAPDLEQARGAYDRSMRIVASRLPKADVSTALVGVVDANVTARGEAAKATYNFLEQANLHCAGER